VGEAVYPLTLALFRRLLPQQKVSAAVALSAGAFGLGTMAGFAGGGYDWRGTIALAIAAIALLVALTLVVPLGWASAVTAGLLALAIIAAFAWARLVRLRKGPP
jgi:hypothetical protein